MVGQTPAELCVLACGQDGADDRNYWSNTVAAPFPWATMASFDLDESMLIEAIGQPVPQAGSAGRFRRPGPQAGSAGCPRIPAKDAIRCQGVRRFITLVVMLGISVADAACVFDAQGIGGGAGSPDATVADARALPDAALPDAAPPDATPPAFTVAAGAHASAVASLTYALQIPAGERRLLLVFFQLPTSCGNTAPSVTGVTYGGTALTRVTSISGTPCGGNTLSEAWQLVAPPVGAHDVQVSLAGDSIAVLSTASLTET